MAPPPPNVVGSLSGRRPILNRPGPTGSRLPIQLAPVPRAAEKGIYSRRQLQLVYLPDSIYGRVRLLCAVPRSWAIARGIDSRSVSIRLWWICRDHSMAADAQRSRLGPPRIPVLAARAER